MYETIFTVLFQFISLFFLSFCLFLPLFSSQRFHGLLIHKYLHNRKKQRADKCKKSYVHIFAWDEKHEKCIQYKYDKKKDVRQRENVREE